MTEQIKLPDGWVWRDYDQPTVASKNASSGMYASHPCPATKIRTWGVIPAEVQQAFELRSMEIDKAKEVARVVAEIEAFGKGESEKDIEIAKLKAELEEVKADRAQWRKYGSEKGKEYFALLRSVGENEKIIDRRQLSTAIFEVHWSLVQWASELKKQAEAAGIELSPEVDEHNIAGRMPEKLENLIHGE